MPNTITQTSNNFLLETINGSFRDPSGFLYSRNNTLYRQINNSYKDHYESFISSGLYRILVDKKLLIQHIECDLELAKIKNAYKIISPEFVKYISYPYEWCFGQLKDAALTTLRIQLLALQHGMTLKDASAYNIQFHQGKCIFIDTLSFEIYHDGSPWIAYRQFCQHFLAPLALMANTDIRLNQLLRTNIDGVPLDLASRLLPVKTWFNFSLLSHIHLHAKMQAKYADSASTSTPTPSPKNIRISKSKLFALIHNLTATINKLNIPQIKTEWGSYYQDTNYQNPSMRHKEELVEQFITDIRPSPVFVQDLGANDGRFSRIVAKSGANVISQDIDVMAVEKNYQQCQAQTETNILPLLQDLTNPSPASGWNNTERNSFVQRAKSDAVLALALIHHLAISNNVPLDLLSTFFSDICHWLIIEFVPKSDSQVVRLLATREDIFHDYTIDGFKRAFSTHFEIIKQTEIRDSDRTLFLMKKKL